MTSDWPLTFNSQMYPIYMIYTKYLLRGTIVCPFHSMANRLQDTRLLKIGKIENVPNNHLWTPISQYTSTLYRPVNILVPSLRPAFFELQRWWKLGMCVIISDWHWTLNRQKFPIIRSVSIPEAHIWVSIALRPAICEIQGCCKSENRKCTEQPRNYR